MIAGVAHSYWRHFVKTIGDYRTFYQIKQYKLINFFYSLIYEYNMYHDRKHQIEMYIKR